MNNNQVIPGYLVVTEQLDRIGMAAEVLLEVMIHGENRSSFTLRCGYSYGLLLYPESHNYRKMQMKKIRLTEDRDTGGHHVA